MKLKRMGIVGLALLCWMGLAAGQARHPVSGRQIAPVMGVGGADWLVRPERAEEEKPDLAVKLMDLRPGMVVADIGAGVGYFSLKMAQQVGPSGKVYAVDIQPEMLTRLRQRANEAHVTNVETVLGAPADPKLPAGMVDLALMVDVYHELSQPQAVLRGIAKALKPDGRLVLLEYRAEDPNVPIRELHKMTVAQVRQELEAEGYRFDRVLEDLPWQHLLIFRRGN